MVRQVSMVVTGFFVLCITQHEDCNILKGHMILRCVKKAISYKCPYVIAVVVPYQIYTVVIMTICANQENNIV